MSGNNIIQQAQQAGEALDGFGSWWDGIWKGIGTVFNILLWGIPLMLGGGWLINQFHDRLPEGFMQFLAPIVESIMNILPEGVREFLQPMFGNFSQYLTAEGARNMVAQVAGRELADALITNDQDLQTLQRALQASGRGASSAFGSGGIAAAAFNEHTLTALIRDPNGQTMLRRALPVIARQRTSTGEDSNEQNQVAMNAIRAMLNNRQLFSSAASAPGAMDFMYDAAATLANITIRPEARAIIGRLDPEVQRTLFASAIGGEDGQPNTAAMMGAFTNMLTNESFTPQDLRTLFQNIDVPAGSQLSERLTVLKNYSEQDFTNLLRSIQVIGVDNVLRLVEQPDQAVPVLVELATRSENPLTGAQLSTLASLIPSGGDGNPLGVLGPILSDPTKADAAITLIQTMERNEAGSFGRLAELISDATVTIPEGEGAEIDALRARRNEAVAALIEFMGDERHAAAITAFLEVAPELTEHFVDPETFTNVIPNTRAAVAAAAVARDATNAMSEQEQAQMDRAIQAAVRNQDYSQLTQMLFENEDLRGRLLNNTRIQDNIVTIAGQNNPNASYGELTARAFLTGDGTNTNVAWNQGSFTNADGSRAAGVGNHNLRAVVMLIEAIDNTTGAQYRNAAGQAIVQDEGEADRRSARVVNFLIRVASGQATAAELEQRGPDGTTLIEDISRRMNDHNVVTAINNFFLAVDTGNMSPEQQQLFSTLREHFYIDSNGDGRMQRRDSRFLSLRIFDHNDDGLAPYLADPNHAAIVLRSILGNNGFLGLGLHWESGNTQTGMPFDANLRAIREAGADVVRERDNFRPNPIAVPAVDGGRDRTS